MALVADPARKAAPTHASHFVDLTGFDRFILLILPAKSLCCQPGRPYQSPTWTEPSFY
jgi:hypothetical protein